jgi:beta-glucanase (GH16 family)
LPAGLTLSSVGVVSGTPSAAGNFTFTAQVKDSASSPQTATQAQSIAVAAAGSSTQPTPPPQAAGYNLAFDDEFNTLNLSPNGTGNYNWYNPGIYFENPAPTSNISVSNSALTLTWNKNQSGGNYDTTISTTAVDASHYHAWRYGYFEVRMKWNVVNGSWPAIWMWSVQGLQASKAAGCAYCGNSGELDIFEGAGSAPHTYLGTIHDWVNAVDTANNNNSDAYNLSSTNDFSQYHTYGVLWVPGSVTWYYDNQPLHSAPTYPIFDQQDYYLMLGSQEGVNGNYGDMSGVTATSIPMTVDWVHVWQLP